MEDKVVCFTEDELLKPREIIIDLMQHMINTGLTDFSGGNMALRIGEKIYSTQTFSAEKYRWRLKPDNIIVSDINKNILEGQKEKLSREADLHLGIFKKFPDINCTIHGNSFYSPLLVSEGVKVAGVTEVAEYYNIDEIPVVPEGIEPLSDEENSIIISYFEKLKKNGNALVAIMPYHGLIVGAKEHNEAFALYHAVESNSKFIFERMLLKTSLLVNKVFEKLLDKNKNVDNYQKISTSNNKSSDFYCFKSNILTAEDIELISKKSNFKKIEVNPDCIITEVARNKARELDLKIVRV
ncbi:MAG: class II aldolase/adducin family protein [Actinobacteria bacterium]|nr:class II aldolase/adducin family protein [Actinomycetota bacterium]